MLPADTVARPKVSVVDDDLTMRILARATLEEAGFDVSEAVDGESGLDTCRDGLPDLVLLDVEMPGIDGFEVCRRLRELADAVRLPIIMVTGHDDTASISRAYELGATDFISKPINWPILAHRTRYVLRGAVAMRRLRMAEERNAAMLAAIPDMIFRVDPGGALLDFKPSGEPGPLLLSAEAVGCRIGDLLPPPAAGTILASLLPALASQGMQTVGFALPGSDGEHHYEARIVPAGTGELLGVVRDITQRHRAETAMRQALVVFEVSSQGILTTDAEHIITTVNPAFCAISGHRAEDLVGTRWSMFDPERHDADFVGLVRAELADSDTWQGEVWSRRASGEGYPLWLNASVVRDPSGNIVEYVLLCSDITLRKQHEDAIWRQANFDTLTGLANRNLLHDRVERAIAQAKRKGTRLGLIYLDLDGFKAINDRLGHDAGDALLVEAARRLCACVRDQDTVARLGGDEFTVAIHDLVNARDLLGVGAKLIEALRQPFELADGPHSLSASAGLTVYPDDGDDLASLLKNADGAMYRAKQAGKNRLHCHAPRLQMQASERRRIEADLRAAVERDAFALHYQPIVDARNGRLVGAEALVRCRHPQRGLVEPLEFIPVAEDSELILVVGEWVLREAARQWREWRDRGLQVPRLAVNVSSVQFREAGLPELVTRVLEQYGVDRDGIMLEISEAMLFERNADVAARLRAIRDCGVGYSIDDFGAGSGALARLTGFPVDILKIEQAFFRDCPADADDARLVTAIVGIAHGMNLRVTAEGVETEAQRDFLRSIGCDHLQGFLFGRPMSAGQFETLIGRSRAT